MWEIAGRKPELELKCNEITNNENILKEFLDECYDFYTCIPYRDLYEKDKKGYRWS